MTEIRLSDQLRSNYEDYYEHEDSEWRRLGALDKASNIVSLCRDLPQRSVLGIGAGEGSILKRLSKLTFGDELYALEISPSGVKAIKRKAIPRPGDQRVYLAKTNNENPPSTLTAKS